jgi:hypothetical protein
MSNNILPNQFQNDILSLPITSHSSESWPIYNWLSSYDWQYWGTLTTPYKMSKQSARRLGNAYARAVLRNNFLKGNKVFWVAEPHKTGDFHLHYLVELDSFVDRWQKEYWTELNHVARRMTSYGRIETRLIRAQDATKNYTHRDGIRCIDYCAKYICKGGVQSDRIDWDILSSDHVNNITTQKSLF